MSDAPKGIKAVFFDLGQVLLRFSHEDIIDRLSSGSGTMGEPEREAMFGFLFDERDGLCNLYDAGQVGSREFYGGITERFDIGVGYDEFVQLWNGIFTENEEVSALARRVRERRPVYLLSNVNELHWEHIRDRYAILRELDGLVLSYLVGAKKPDPVIYEAALRTAGVGPGESVFIDDLHVNIEAAKAHGIDGIVFTGTDALRERLEELGLI